MQDTTVYNTVIEATPERIVYAESLLQAYSENADMTPAEWNFLSFRSEMSAVEIATELHHMDSYTEDGVRPVGVPRDTLTELENAAPTEPVSQCCSATLYDVTIRVGDDGKFAEDGKMMLVRKCTKCGETFVRAPEKIDFLIDDDDKAEWYLRVRFLKGAEITLLKEQHAARIAALEGDMERFEGFFGPQFEAYAENKIAAQKNARSYKFAYGTASKRKVAGTWKVFDTVAALATAQKEYPDAIITRTTHTLDTDALFEYAAKRTEPIPGVRKEEDRESFSISFTPRKRKKGKEPATVEPAAA